MDINFETQICTTKEQSQQLLELGLSPETADMKIVPYSDIVVSYECSEYDYLDVYPAWSLHRLIYLCDTMTMAIPRDKLKNAYEYQIFILETLINTNQFNTNYLINKSNMENKEMKELELIPEGRLSGVLEYIEESNMIDSICPKCESFISTKHYPYAYDTENNDVVYVSRCPNCGEILYSKD